MTRECPPYLERPREPDHQDVVREGRITVAAVDLVRVAPRAIAVDGERQADGEGGAAVADGQARLHGDRVAGPAESLASPDEVGGGHTLQAAAQARGEEAVRR